MLSKSTRSSARMYSDSSDSSDSSSASSSSSSGLVLGTVTARPRQRLQTPPQCATTLLEWIGGDWNANACVAPERTIITVDIMMAMLYWRLTKPVPLYYTNYTQGQM
mmetsp:Transcript_10123/g.23682  ORF Transcript_10123/g.23682 Transcript_10123/m.23682 type:complete len:107 (-) Transcript_10123:161-481(-)